MVLCHLVIHSTQPGRFTIPGVDTRGRSIFQSNTGLYRFSKKILLFQNEESPMRTTRTMYTFLHVTETPARLTCDLETVVKGITFIEIVGLHVAEIQCNWVAIKKNNVHWLLIPKVFVQIGT
jgi:hypothetical protein